MNRLLELEGIAKSFGAVRALHGARLSVGAGEVVALVGDNGAGKSTLIKVMAGVGPADHGTVRFDGKETSVKSPHDSTSLGIATVYQDLALCNNLDVASNLFLGHEISAPGIWRLLGFTNKVEMRRQAQELLKSLSVKIPDVTVPVGSLSGGQRQAVAIARSLLGEPKVVLLDEPTAALGVEQTEQVLALILQLRARGLGVVVISHNIADVMEVADRVTVLRLGTTVFDESVADTSREAIVAAITGASTAHHPSRGMSA